jgi:hypothetical protein
MFTSIKNKEQRLSLIELLLFAVENRESGAGFIFAPATEARMLQDEEPTFVILDHSVKNAEGLIKVVATQVGVDAVNAYKKFDVESRREIKVKGKDEHLKFEFIKLNSIPEIRRGGRKSESYPFAALNAFPAEPHAFFVPATAAKPNPAKSLASTVASATKRYSKTDRRVFAIRKATDTEGKLIGAHVIRVS